MGRAGSSRSPHHRAESFLSLITGIAASTTLEVTRQVTYLDTVHLGESLGGSQQAPALCCNLEMKGQKRWGLGQEPMGTTLDTPRASPQRGRARGALGRTGAPPGLGLPPQHCLTSLPSWLLQKQPRHGCAEGHPPTGQHQASLSGHRL